MIVTLLALLVSATVSTILSDSGCHCALLKNINTTPGAGTTPLGCSIKPDWNGTLTQWCLTDESPGPCGGAIASFGVVDTCGNAGFSAVNITPSGTLYTGQNLTVTWATTNILPDELYKISYKGSTIATNVTAGSAVARLTTAGTNMSVVVNTLSSPAITRNSSSLLTVLQSGLTGATLTYNGTSIVGTTQPVDDRLIRISWGGVGDAVSGNTSVIVKSSGGTRIVGSPVWTLGNSTLYMLPRSFVPSGGGGGGTTYLAAITLLSPSGITYTFNSPSFSLSTAPSQTPTPSRTPQTPSFTSSISLTTSITPTQTPSQTQTPTPSLSFGATASNTGTTTPTISLTVSVSPSQSPTSTLTSSQTATQTPAASVDYVGLAAAASAAATAKSEAILGGVIGGIVGIVVVGIGSYKVYQRYEYRQRRLRSLQATSRRLAQSRGIQESAAVVGLNPAVYEFTRPRTLRSQHQSQRQQGRVRK